MAYSQYNAKQVSVVIEDGNSTVNITGFGEDMVTGEKDEELSSFSVGAQGDVVDSAINNDLGTISLTVQRTCPQKNYLLSLKNKVFGIWVTDKNLNERYGGSKAKLKNIPEMTHGAEAEDMTFEIQVIDYTVEPIA